MNKKLHPGIVVLVVLAAIGVAFGIMLSITERKPPPIPSSMGEAMKKSGAQGGARPNATSQAATAPKPSEQKPDKNK